MSQQQYEWWVDKMIAIATFYRGDIEFYQLIDILEPPSDSNKFNNLELIQGWRSHWEQLSKISYDNIMAVKVTMVEEVKEKLEAFRKFLFDNMEKAREM